MCNFKFVVVFLLFFFKEKVGTNFLSFKVVFSILKESGGKELFAFKDRVSSLFDLGSWM